MKTKSRQLSPKKTRAVATVSPEARELQTLKSRALSLVESSRSIQVKDTPSFERAGDLVKDAVGLRKDLQSTAFYRALVEAKADLKTKDQLYKSVEKLVKDAEDLIRDSLSRYAAEQRWKQEKAIERAMEKGKDEKAATIAATPFVPPVQGLSFTEHWHAEVESLHALVKAAASDANLLAYLDANMVALNALARLQKDSMAIPGVKAVKETSSSVRA